jgi:enolase
LEPGVALIVGQIEAVTGRRVWDSRGRPTIEVEIRCSSGATGRAIAPAGASRGRAEAVDLRDGGPKLGGLGVQRGLANIGALVQPALRGLDISDQAIIDRRLRELDPSPNLERLGGNVAVATSLACAWAGASDVQLPLWRYLLGGTVPVIPLPEIQIFGGGAHASRRLDLQDLMVVCPGAASFDEALEWTAEIYLAAGRLMAERGALAGVADEGGWWPHFDSNEDALATLTRAIEASGRHAGQDVAIALDVAASELVRDGHYHLDLDGVTLDSEAMGDHLLDWCRRFPIISVEDPLGEDDTEGLSRFTAEAKQMGVQVVGDDALATSASRVKAAAAGGWVDTLLLKPNQAGTLTAAAEALAAARAANFGCIASARSGETEDVSIVHLAVGWGIAQLKVGSITRGERTAKWNEVLRIEDATGAGLARPFL